MKKLNIAIDGPAGAGKSTVAKQVASRLGLTYIDTGAMYRALTWKALRAGINVEDRSAVAQLALLTEIRLLPARESTVLCDDLDVSQEIRSPEVSNAVSKVASYPEVRNRMVDLQRQMAAREGVVMDGRDIGTTVLPDAPFKFFLTASITERARRRWLELTEAGYEVNCEELALQMAERDKQDETRATAPLVPAPDARLLNTEGLNIEEVVDRILKTCAGEMN